MRRAELCAGIAGLAILVAACTPAEKTAEQMENSAGRAGNAAVAMGDSLANSVEKGAKDVRREIDKPVDRDAWVGRWKGVEGTYLVVAKGTKPGRYRLEMQYTLDDKGSFDGTANADGIAFTRPDGDQLLKASDGDATGLKWLAGKRDCLKVKDGEGYCRD